MLDLLLRVSLSVSSVLIFIIAFVLFRGTILDIRYPRRNPWPLFLYIEIALILFPINLVVWKKGRGIDIIHTDIAGLEFWIGIWVLMTLYILIVFISVFIYLLGFGNCKITSDLEQTSSLRNLQRFAISLSLSGTIILLVFHFFSYRHAFIYSLIIKQPLIVVRLYNKYYTAVPSQLSSLLPMIGYLLSGSSGFLFKNFPKRSLIYLAFSIFIVSASGDKAPILRSIMIWLFASGLFLPKSLFSISAFWGGIGGSALLIFILYLTTSIQYPNLESERYVHYIFARVGVGQMAGTFETFGLLKQGMLPKGKFYWHLVPGARLFVNYIDYQKALMMIIEGYRYTQMGVKNTYFLAEAYAIGGPILAIISPLIVACSMIFSLFVLDKYMRKIFPTSLGLRFALIVWTQHFSITGGFASFPLCKGLFLILFHLTLIISLHSLLTRLLGE